MKNIGALLGVAIIAGTLGFSAYAFKGAITNMVPFSDARLITGSTVQIMGSPAAGTLGYANGVLHFSLRNEKGDLMPVTFKGPKPDDLDSAMSKASKITAIGTYDASGSQFVADKLLVKCPSKYQNSASSDRNYGTS